MVSHRPDTDELVLQMTIIAPWGEVGRAVRLICPALDPSHSRHEGRQDHTAVDT